MEMKWPVVAGMASTVLFAISVLPMLRKVWRTKDLRSYSLDSILLTNMANVVHAVYVFDLPPGPIWLLHSFYMFTSVLLLGFYLRFEWRPMCSRLWHKVKHAAESLYRRDLTSGNEVMCLVPR